MKKLNTNNAFAMLVLGLTLSVVGAGFATNSVSADSQLISTATTKAPKTGSSDSGAGNGTTKSAPTTIAKTGSSDSGAGNGTTKSTPTTIAKTGSSDSGAGNGTTKSAPTTIAKTGSSDGGTGKSVTVSDSELEKSMKGMADNRTVTLTNVQMNALTTAQWEKIDGLLSSSQVASIPTKTIKNLSTAALEGLTSDGTKALTTAQLKVMSKDQLNALVSSGELTDTQLDTVNKKLKQLG